MFTGGTIWLVTHGQVAHRRGILLRPAGCLGQDPQSCGEGRGVGGGKRLLKLTSWGFQDGSVRSMVSFLCEFFRLVLMG